MRAVCLLTALAIGFLGPVPGSASVARAAVGPAEGSDRAKELFYEGSAQYSAADYTGAIDSFTEALKIVTAQGADPGVRGALLQNLAKAHVKAYDVDSELRHLKTAREIYQGYVREADSAGYSKDDVDDAGRKSEELSGRIDEIEAQQRADSRAGGPAPAAAATPADDSANKRRVRGIALVVTGSILTGAGIGALIWGSTFKGFAEDAVKDQDATEEDKQTYIDDEDRKGKIWMGVGGGLAAVGIAGIVVGAIDLVKAKKAKQSASMRLSPMVGRGATGLVIRGRF